MSITREITNNCNRLDNGKTVKIAITMTMTMNVTIAMKNVVAIAI